MGQYFYQIKAASEISNATGKWVVLVHPPDMDLKEKQILYDDFVSVGTDYGGVFGRTFSTRRGGSVSLCHVEDEIFAPESPTTLISMVGWDKTHTQRHHLERWLRKATLLTYTS